MDIVDSINRYLAGDKEVPKAVKSRLTRARDEIVLLRKELESARREAYESKHCQCGYDDVCGYARERDALKAELAELKNQEPACYAVFNPVENEYGYTAAWANACHEHINDCIIEYDIDCAGKWVVRPLYLAAGAKEKAG